MDYADDLYKKLFDAGIRVAIDDRAEKIGYKIREAQLEKVPYMIIVGEKEANEGNVSVRSRDGGELGSLSVEEFVEKLVAEAKDRI